MLDDVLSRIREGRLWDFPGGVHPQENKKQSNQKPIRRLHLPKFFYVPVVQHSGEAGDLIVQVGERVLKGQPLTRGDHYRQLPVHSPTSGVITAVAPHVSSHPSGLPELTVVIETDGKDEWVERQPIDDFMQLTSGQIVEKIYQAGIAGLGGAVFPTSSKLSFAEKRCKLLIINGAECEPYITCDDRLMQDYTLDMIEGIRILRYVLRPEEVVIAIEDNKPQAIKAVEKALEGSNDIQLRVIPTKYPSGASDQLVQILTGLEIPQGKRTIELGIVMQNVGTAYAVKRAIINDEPLIERVVTLTGDKIRNKGNVWARLGTPILHLLEQVDYQQDERFPVFLGGPMMGFILPSLLSPVTKTANCIIAPDHFEYAPPEPERNCIRCSNCSDYCPVGLLPQQLYWFARAEDHEKSKQYHLDACIECGVCAYVCPSYIPLIQYFRQEKAKISEADEKARKAEEAKQRFEAREARMQKEKEARNARIQQAAEKRREEVANSDGVDPVKAALERLKAKKVESTEQKVTTAGEPDNADLIAQRKARRAAKLAEQEAQTQAVENSENSAKSESTDDKKAAVAAALARAKAQKAQQQANENGGASPTLQNSVAKGNAGANNHSPETDIEDPRKTAVAAALARAKAKKAAQQANENGGASPPLQNSVAEGNVGANNHSPEADIEDPRKAAVAAALARAKAKKAAQQAVENSENSAKSDNDETSRVGLAPPADDDPRKAAVAAALARAKAKKAAQQANENGGASPTLQNSVAEGNVGTNNHSPETDIEDPRKAAVAAALARAKAKKAAQQAVENSENSAKSDNDEASRVGLAPPADDDPRKAAVAAALARAKAKKAAQQANENGGASPTLQNSVAEGNVEANNHSPETDIEDPRKAAVAAALARAKAKKAQQQANENGGASPTLQNSVAEGNAGANNHSSETDIEAPLKAAVAAALARAKAKKAVQQANENGGASPTLQNSVAEGNVEANNHSPEAEIEDPRKVAVAAALARAKARKAAQQANENGGASPTLQNSVAEGNVEANNHSPETDIEDPRKAAVAAALARAKAKKAQQQANENGGASPTLQNSVAEGNVGANNHSPEAEIEDPRKAAIAAALARAKARKAAQQEKNDV